MHVTAHVKLTPYLVSKRAQTCAGYLCPCCFWRTPTVHRCKRPCRVGGLLWLELARLPLRKQLFALLFTDANAHAVLPCSDSLSAAKRPCHVGTFLWLELARLLLRTSRTSRQPFALCVRPLHAPRRRPCSPSTVRRVAASLMPRQRKPLLVASCTRLCLSAHLLSLCGRLAAACCRLPPAVSSHRRIPCGCVQ